MALRSKVASGPQRRGEDHKKMLRRAQQTRNVGDSERGSLFGSVLGTKLEKVTRAQGLGTGDADRCDTRKKQFGNIFSGLSFLWMRREMERRKKKVGFVGGWLVEERGKGKKKSLDKGKRLGGKKPGTYLSRCCCYCTVYLRTAY